MTLVINFSHPLTGEQIAQIESLTGQPVERTIPVPVQFDNREPFIPQLGKLIQSIPLTSDEFQTIPVLIVPPALNFITALLLAELHGRMGYFPPMVRIRPVANAVPQRFEVAEILNLQAVREHARQARFG